LAEVTPVAHGKRSLRHHERSADRLTGDGHRERSLDTRLGSLNLKIPKGS
jgi:hypothetical protein